MILDENFWSSFEYQSSTVGGDIFPIPFSKARNKYPITSPVASNYSMSFLLLFRMKN